ncbi:MULTISPECIES: hypothetical protein [Microcystis]|uniref:Transposase n=1 Tax=Microcystis aeruginosa PCC 9807 TaxID=1160283 RepID=I4H6Y2_MICAE|nr:MULTISPECIES: hypothetical protein [Microcystis]CCI17806.1 hypothetical protein MICAF_3190003 [Microcystis aeruginosa PCC 9807]
MRLQAGRNAQPSAGSVDSQSVKTASGEEDISFDGGKKVTRTQAHNFSR